MKVYLDDVRIPPPDWKLVHKVEEVQSLLKTGEVTHLSLDHDLGASYICDGCGLTQHEIDGCDLGIECYCDCHFAVTPTGYDLVRWMVEHDIWPLNKPTVHSANPVGAKRMREDIDKYWHPPRNT